MCDCPIFITQNWLLLATSVIGILAAFVLIHIGFSNRMESKRGNDIAERNLDTLLKLLEFKSGKPNSTYNSRHTFVKNE